MLFLLGRLRSKDKRGDVSARDLRSDDLGGHNIVPAQPRHDLYLRVGREYRCLARRVHDLYFEPGIDFVAFLAEFEQSVVAGSEATTCAR
jgi:hypothetical protein